MERGGLDKGKRRLTMERGGLDKGKRKLTMERGWLDKGKRRLTLDGKGRKETKRIRIDVKNESV